MVTFTLSPRPFIEPNVLIMLYREEVWTFFQDLDYLKMDWLVISVY